MFLLEFLDDPAPEAIRFDTEEDLNATLNLLRGCPVDDGPVRIRVTRLGVVSQETFEITASEESVESDPFQ